MIATADRFRLRGNTLFEWAVIACVLTALLAVFFNRVQQYQQEAELVHARQVAAALRIALAARAAQVVSAQGAAGLEALARRNPIELLIQPPANYVGEYYKPDIQLIPEGHWYFDRFDKTLVYFSNRYKSFPSEPSKFLRFKVKSIGLPSSAAEGGRSKDTMGLALEDVE